MKKRFRLMMILIGMILVGVVFLQADWLSKSYKLSRVKFLNDATKIFERSLQEELQIRKDTLDSILVFILSSDRIKVIVTPKDSTYRFFVDMDGKERFLEYKAAPGNYHAALQKVKAGGEVSTTKLLVELSHDSYFFVQKILDQYINLDLPPLDNSVYERCDLDTLRSIYSRNLRAHGITDTFQLEETAALTKPGEDSSSSLVLSTPYYFSGLMPLLNGPTYVRVTFKKTGINNWNYLLRNTVSSVLINLITLICAIIILRIYLRQRKLTNLKDDFINSMTHELKTPVSVASAAVEALSKLDNFDDKAKIRRFLTYSQAELAKLSYMVNNVLEVSASEEATADLAVAEFSVGALIEERIISNKLRSPKEVNFIFNNRLENDRLKTDRFHFSNIIDNIIDNAIKYSNEEVDIKIDLYEEAQTVHLRIADNGIGMDSQHSEKIFEKFYRAPQHRNTGIGGSGLGLYYSKKMIEKMGGAITAASKPREGTVFTIIFPKH